VFGTATVASAAEQTEAWERHKAAERRAAGGAAGALDGIALGLPALTRAAKLGRRAAAVRFDWARAEDVLAKVDEEVRELRQARADGEAGAVAEEIGDLLFSVAQFARHAGVDPEAALRAANAKFERRFRHMESWLAERGREPSQADADELESLWAKAKQDLG
jgi:MazG family protein